MGTGGVVWGGGRRRARRRFLLALLLSGTAMPPFSEPSVVVLWEAR
jgi:hypothetical protein